MNYNEQFEFDGDKYGTGLAPSPADHSLLRHSRFDESLLLDDEEIKLLLQGHDPDTVRQFYRKWLINQGQIGSCNAAATIGAKYRIRDRMGLPHIPLSENDLYIRINGGSDRGSMLDDGFDELQNGGVATRLVQVAGKEIVYPYQAYNKRQLPRGLWDACKEIRADFLSWEPIRIPTGSNFARAIASCIARRWPIIVAWHVGGKTWKLDGNGYIQQGRGPGNHASFLDGAKFVGGQDIVHPNLVNSWTATDSMYGPVRQQGWGIDGCGLTTMDDMQILIDLHKPNPRQGPGSEESTDHC